MITIKNGDLLRATEDIIAHQVNCHGVAGGLAAAIFDAWPEAGKAYDKSVRAARRRASQIDLLGSIGIVNQPDSKSIANLYGQYWPGADYRPDILRNCLEILASNAKRLGKSVAIPYGLSCGICGGDWNQVYKMIEETMQDVEVTIYRKSN